MYFKKHLAYLFYTFLLLFVYATSNVYAEPTQVWVNSKSKLYHSPGARWYGNTKIGRFITEGKAISLGARPMHGVRCN